MKFCSAGDQENDTTYRDCNEPATNCHFIGLDEWDVTIWLCADHEKLWVIDAGGAHILKVPRPQGAQEVHEGFGASAAAS